MLKIYNSLTNQKEVFEPIEANKIRMYVCGMTVYDYCHLGHARVMVAFDVVFRYLKSRGYDVNYIRNITDIDDKIIQRANENSEDFLTLTNRFIDAMHEDEVALGIQKPSSEPRATDHIDEILVMITSLIEKGYAYQGKSGDVYYDVSKFEDYGKLSGRNPDDLRSGERIAVNEDKDDPLDFVLWKMAKPDEPYWESPWGNGRPGWHIECSAMSTNMLGNHFDIHGGGHDLQFPHHENEIAQSEACTGEHFANYWMHNGFIRIDEEKMSKSLGNFFTIRDVLKEYKAEEVRYFMLTSQYRSPLNYSTDQLDAAGAALDRLYTALRGLTQNIENVPSDSEYEKRFVEAMDDDFNTPEALAVLFELAREINRARTDENEAEATALGSLMKKLAGQLGLLDGDIESWFQGESTEDGLSNEEIEVLIQQRIDAKANKDWGMADKIRDELVEQGNRTATVRHKVGFEELRPGGTVSGPAMMAVADVALYVTILGEIGLVALAVTTNLTINFLRKPSPEKDIVAKCSLIKVGKTLVVGEVRQHMAKYMEWLSSLGDAAVSPMNPLGSTHTIMPDGEVSEGSKVSMSGYTVVEADSIEAAISMAKSCPFLNINGTLEVSELIQMPVG
ncbi:Cysteine--tRNA ligase [Nymphon striatum]|nr:Cysteine--tRNA ligase [Nymphon striatum]